MEVNLSFTIELLIGVESILTYFLARESLSSAILYMSCGITEIPPGVTHTSFTTIQSFSSQLCLSGEVLGCRGCPVVQLQNLSLLLTMPEPEMTQLLFNIPTEVLSSLN